MPCIYGVLTVRNVGDGISTVRASLSKVRSWRNNDVAGHFRVNVAEQRHHAGIVELECLFLSLGPGSHVMGLFLVAGNRRPEDVVLDLVTVEEIHGGSRLDHHHMMLVA